MGRQARQRLDVRRVERERRLVVRHGLGRVVQGFSVLDHALAKNT